jgi:hypothetical protein
MQIHDLGKYLMQSKQGWNIIIMKTPLNEFNSGVYASYIPGVWTKLTRQEPVDL